MPGRFLSIDPVMAAESFVPGFPLLFPDHGSRTGNREGRVLHPVIRELVLPHPGRPKILPTNQECYYGTYSHRPPITDTAIFHHLLFLPFLYSTHVTWHVVAAPFGNTVCSRRSFDREHHTCEFPGNLRLHLFLTRPGYGTIVTR